MSSTKYYFNAPIQLPKGSSLALENNSGNKLFFESNSSMASNYNLVFPANDGTNGQALITDGAGNLTFGDVVQNISSVSSNLITNSSTGDILFTTDNGNTTITSNGNGKFLKLNNNNGEGIIIGTKENPPLNNNDLANISMFISNTTINYVLDTITYANVQMNNSNIEQAFLFNSSLSTFNYKSNIDSTSPTTGTIILEENSGLGVGGNTYIGGLLNVNGNVNFNNNTESTTTTNGSLVVSGGVGISSNVNVGGNVNISNNLIVSGDLTVNGTTTTINSTVTTIEDPVIQLGNDNAVDTFDRGIKGVYNNGASFKSLFFGWDRSENRFTFIPDATYLSSNVASGTEGNVFFGGITANASTSSTSTGTGALIVRGGAGVGENLYVGGNVNVSSTLNVTDATTLSSTLTVTGVTTLNNNTILNGNFIQSVNEFNDSTVSRTNLWNGSNSAPSKHILLDTVNMSLYSANAITSVYTTGQTMNLFFTNNSGGTANANIDFGPNKLYSGSGLAQYLVFNTSGQSATLIFINASGNNDGWRIINCGASVF